MARVAWGDIVAVTIVSILALAAVLSIALIFYLAAWWQPDCHNLHVQGRECRDWPWQEAPRDEPTPQPRQTPNERWRDG